ncbi:MAG TPA: type II toxin-antitoxin system HicA family toxin [Candidatus Nanoarchaeia archaeon]|nr:type II toxin-antitoxin system HicA family toxin [Candidatus Nanoarchaeia archaeon]
MKLTPTSGRELCKIVEKLGFVRVRQTGSHIRYEHPDGRKTTIPLHGNEEIGKGLLLEILHQIKLSRDEFLKLR